MTMFDLLFHWTVALAAGLSVTVLVLEVFDRLVPAEDR